MDWRRARRLPETGVTADAEGEWRVLITGFPADAFGTNCYLIAAGEGEQCLVVDPGIGILDQLDDQLATHKLSPAAVLLTHGHLDHTFSVAPICDARGITAYIHSDDRELLADPAKALSMDLSSLFGGRLPYSEPDDVAEMSDGTVLEIAGVSITVAHAPGHTGGSVLFHLTGMDQPHCFSGDVLFAGSIGRTDLPGGDAAVMMTSLRDKILPLADDTIVLPGHGPPTTIGRERTSNPFLHELDSSSGPAGSRRGW